MQLFVYAIVLALAASAKESSQSEPLESLAFCLLALAPRLAVHRLSQDLVAGYKNSRVQAIWRHKLIQMGETDDEWEIKPGELEAPKLLDTNERASLPDTNEKLATDILGGVGNMVDNYVGDKVKQKYEDLDSILARFDRAAGDYDTVSGNLSEIRKADDSGQNNSIDEAVRFMTNSKNMALLEKQLSDIKNRRKEDNANANIEAALADKMGNLNLDLPDEAVIAVAAGDSDLGQLLVKALPNIGKAWTVRELSLTSPRESFSGVDAVILILEGASGKGGIKTTEVNQLVKKIGTGIRRFVVASVRGVADTSMFNMANLFGQLDKLRFAEEEIVLNILSRRKLDEEGNVIPVPGFTIVRLGKLIDDSEVVSAIVSPPQSRDELVVGDAAEGDVSMSTAAAVLIEALKQPTDARLSLGKASANFGEVSDDQIYWDDQFLKIVGPEIFRKPFSGAATNMVKRLQDWAMKFQNGKGLTSPAGVAKTDNGALLQFYIKKGQGRKNDGGLLFVADPDPSPRVRVVRFGMDERDDIVSKPMSEATLLDELGKLVE